MKILRFTSKILPVVTIVLIVIEIFATNELVGVGRTIRDVDTAIDVTQEENDNLSHQVASASALWVIEEKANAMGYKKPSQYVSIGGETVALNPGH